MNWNFEESFWYFWGCFNLLSGFLRILLYSQEPYTEHIRGLIYQKKDEDLF